MHIKYTLNYPYICINISVSKNLEMNAVMKILAEIELIQLLNKTKI